MALLAPNEGEVVLLSIMVNKKTQANLTLRLFTAPTTSLAETVAFTDLTEPSGGTGYATATLTGSSWTVSTDGFGVTTASYPQVTFTFSSAPSAVYGYAVTYNDSGTNRIAWIERFTGAPFTLPSGGGTIAITPAITLE